MQRPQKPHQKRTLPGAICNCCALGNSCRKRRCRVVRTARTRRMVPELTRSADIKLNKRVSLRRHANALRLHTGQFPHVRAHRGKAVERSYSAGRLCSVHSKAARGLISSSARRGSKHRAQKPCSSPSDLAGRFLELQRLRKQVYELEKAIASGRQQSGGARTDLAECQK